MARFDEVFSTDELPERSSSDPIPAGNYPAEIKGADVKETKAGNGGKYISLDLAVIDGEFAGRRIFGNLNIRNPNPKAEEIGRAQLGELMRAVGLPKLQDSDQLIGCTLQVKVNIKKDEQYGDRNEIKSFKALGPKPPVQYTQQADKPSGSPPWVKK